MRKRVIQCLFILLVAVIVWCPPITNHTEAEDAYSYALWAEKSSYLQILHPNHRLYHPLSKWIYEVSGAERAFPVLQVLSGIFTSATIFLFYFLLKRIGVRSLSIRLGYTLALVFTYGFWRYAREVEVYPMAWIAMLGVLHMLLFKHKNWKFWIALAFALVLAVNVHKGLGVVCVGMTLALIWQLRCWKMGAGCILLAGLLYSSGEAAFKKISPRKTDPLAQVQAGEFGNRMRDVSRPKMGLQISSIPKAAVGLSASMIGSAPIMAFDSVYHLLQNRLFPYRNFDEERFLVAGISTEWKVGWIVALISCLVTGGLLLIDFFKNRKRIFSLANSEAWLIAIGFFAYAGQILLFEPGNPEMWLIGLPLCWLMIAAFFKTPRLMVFWSFTLSLGAANFIGGISLLNNPKNDYDQVTGHVALKNFGLGDLYIVDAKSAVHERFIRYTTKAKVLRVLGNQADTEPLLAEIRKIVSQGGRVIMHCSAVDSKAIDFLCSDAADLTVLRDDLSGSYEILIE